MTPQLLRLPAVMDKTGLSRASIYTRMRKGTFPQAVPLGARSVGWVSDEVDAWIKTQIEVRNRA